jgi:hypothetical protein
MPSFERRDRGADRRLSEIERFGGVRKVLTFSDCDENAELFERHGDTISGRNFPWLHEVRLERSGFSSHSEVRSASEGRFHRTSRSLTIPTDRAFRSTDRTIPLVATGCQHHLDLRGDMETVLSAVLPLLASCLICEGG